MNEKKALKSNSATEKKKLNFHSQKTLIHKLELNSYDLNTSAFVSKILFKFQAGSKRRREQI
jgi:hypothetical protein